MTRQRANKAAPRNPAVAAAGAVRFSSTNRDGKFVQWAWSQRDSMPPAAREGMAQAIYTSMLGHLESTMAEILESQYRGMASAAVSFLVTNTSSSIQAFGSSMTASILDRKKRLSSMSFEPLLAELTILFQPGFSPVLSQFRADLTALRALRNQFVHGRGASMSLTPNQGDPIDTTTYELKEALSRLVAARVIDEANLVASGSDLAVEESALHRRLHSDEAVMYFYGVARKFEAAILELLHPSQEFDTITRLPELQGPA